MEGYFKDEVFSVVCFLDGGVCFEHKIPFRVKSHPIRATKAKRD